MTETRATGSTRWEGHYDYKLGLLHGAKHAGMLDIPGDDWEAIESKAAYEDDDMHARRHRLSRHGAHRRRSASGGR